jgi:single-strand DNA-binding protein
MANFNFNKAIIGGRLTSDVELKQTQSGISVCSFTVAVNRYSKDKEQQTDFISCQAWRNTAEFISKYFRKGSCICIVGSIQTRNWTDQNGTKRYATEVVVDEANFVDGKNEGGQEQGGGYVPEAYKEPAQPKFEEVRPDDDLPF